MFFHGDAEPVINRYGERPYRALPLIRNVRLMPEVFVASISLIVSSMISDRLRDLSNVDLVPCTWGKVYDYPVDPAHVNELVSQVPVFGADINDWLEPRLRPPDTEIITQRYCEVVVPVFTSISEMFVRGTSFDLPPPFAEPQERIITSRELHERYPIVECGRSFICAESVYRILEQYVSDEYLFRILPLDLGY